MMPIVEILSRIQGSSEDARFEAWMELYSSTEVLARQELDRILREPDPILKIYLCRFLAHIHEEKAVRYLCRLLLDDNSVVTDAAKKSFEKNLYDRKLNSLQIVLDAPVATAKFFAIEKLSTGGVMEVVPKLLKMLKEADIQLTLRIITSFRFLPEKILVYELEPYYRHENEEVRFKTILVYGALFEAGYGSAHKYLLRSLRDDSPRVRQTALWSLRRRPSKKDLKLLLQLSLHDSNPMVRQESVLNLASFPTAKVIRHLLYILVNDPNRMVVLKGEAVLLTMPVRRLIKGLKHSLNLADKKLSTKAILLFAEFQKTSSSFYKYVLKSLAQVKDVKDKLPYLEALGILRQHKALPALEDYLRDSPLIAYTAMNSILHIWGRDKNFPALRYLREPNLPVIMYQMVLKHILKIEGYDVGNTELKEDLIQILQSENLNLRYLAAQILSRLPQDQVAEPLLQMMLRETDPSSLRLLRDNIGNLLQGNPQLFNLLFARYRHNVPAIHLLLSFMKDLNLSAAQIQKVVPALLRDSQELFADNLSILCDVVFYFLLSHKITVEELLEASCTINVRDEFWSLLLERIRKNSILKISIPIDKVLSDLRKENQFSKKHMIELLSYSDSPEAISALVSVTCDEDLTSYHQMAAAGLSRMMGLSA